jgi:hypothetical protein
MKNIEEINELPLNSDVNLVFIINVYIFFKDPGESK